MSRVLLVNMPFSSLRWPALGISLLKAGLTRVGIACDLAYLHFDLAEAIGLETYQWINESFGFVLGGERLFARALFGDALPDADAYYREVLLAVDPGFPDGDRAEFEAVGRRVAAFLDDCWSRTDWSQYAVVGFTTTFQQTLAALGLARRIKQSHPGIVIAFGGANCEGEMGAELLRRFPQVDLVFSGESDRTFPQVVAAIIEGKPVGLRSGVLGRGRETAVAECAIIDNLDELPFPDFDDYFTRLASSPLRSAIDPLLLFETARGCWWGAKSQCTFCGLNGGSIAFRSKSPARALEELRYLRTRHGIGRACATDNVLDFRYHETLMPLLRDARLDLELEYELKTNLTRPQVETLVAAGLRAAQLGIETLSTPVLRRMRKGVSAVQNVQTLKWLSATGIEVKWNFLHSVPGEDPADYAALPALFDVLVHLVPPQADGPVRIDRFSPYFQTPDAFGLPAPFPLRAYRHIYPFPDETLTRLAYYFTVDGGPRPGPPAYIEPTLEALERWRAVAGTVTLRQHDQEGHCLLIHDTRPCARAFEYRFTGPDRELYLFCDTSRSFPRIVKQAQQVDPTTRDADVRRRLERWVGDGLMVHLDGAYLSLAL